MNSKKKTGLMVLALVFATAFFVVALTIIPLESHAGSPDSELISAGELEKELIPEEDAYLVEGDKRHLLDNNPEPIFKGQADLPEELFDVDQRIDEVKLASQGAELLSREVMRYGDYLKTYQESRSPEIEEDRLVWVVSVYYPNGFMTKRGLYKDATVTGLYDAETGYYFGFSLVGECDEMALPIG